MIEAINQNGEVYHRKYNINSKGVSVVSSVMPICNLPKDSPIENYIFIDGKFNLDTKVPELSYGFDTLSTGSVLYKFHNELYMLFEEGLYRGAECDSTTYRVKDSKSVLTVYSDFIILNEKEYSIDELLGNIPLTLMFVEFLSALTNLMMHKENNKTFKERNKIENLNMFGGDAIVSLPCTVTSKELLILLTLVKQGRRN